MSGTTPESAPKIDPSAGLHKATILAEALPALQELAGATIVVKYGGNAMVDDELKKAFAATWCSCGPAACTPPSSCTVADRRSRRC